MFYQMKSRRKVTPISEETVGPAIIVMPPPSTLVACEEHVESAKNVEGVDPIAFDTMITQIKSVLEPAVQASDKDGLFIENEKYSITLMKSGLIKIFEKDEG
jgi:hypothetical protein